MTTRGANTYDHPRRLYPDQTCQGATFTYVGNRGEPRHVCDACGFWILPDEDTRPPSRD